MRFRLFAVFLVAFAFGSPLFAQSQRPVTTSSFRYLTPQLAQIINEAAKTYGVDPNLIAIYVGVAFMWLIPDRRFERGLQQ